MVDIVKRYGWSYVSAIHTEGEIVCVCVLELDHSFIQSLILFKLGLSSNCGVNVELAVSKLHLYHLLRSYKIIQQ